MKKTYYPKFAVQKILSLREKGYQIVELTPYQFRVNEALDLYPISGRYHNLKTNDRGNIPFGLL